nr:hypothetical protein Iba_chr14bCG9540 [Ipomoea batatas]
MKQRLMKVSRWILQRSRNVCALQEVVALGLSGIYVFEKILPNIFLILMSILPTMTPKPGQCVKTPFQIWIQMRSSMLGITKID